MTQPKIETERAFSKTLRTIRLLLAKADDAAATPEESATYRAKAEQLMREYRVEEQALIAEDPRSVEPVRIDLPLTNTNSAFWQDYVDLFFRVANHVGIQTKFQWARGELLAMCVGYESDIRYAEALFTSAALVFGVKLEPTYDPNLSDEENIYRLRASGMGRARVSMLVYGVDNGPKVTKIYQAECTRRGEAPKLTGKGVDLATFREAYARNFVTEFSRLLRRSRDAADSVGGTVQLHGRAEKVKEAFYVMFPEYRPSTSNTTAVPEDAPAKTPKARKWTKKDQADYERRTSSKAAVAGRDAGEAAAQEVELDRGHSPAKRLEEPSAPEVTGCFSEITQF